MQKGNHKPFDVNARRHGNRLVLVRPPMVRLAVIRRVKKIRKKSVIID